MHVGNHRYRVLLDIYNPIRKINKIHLSKVPNKWDIQKIGALSYSHCHECFKYEESHNKVSDFARNGQEIYKKANNFTVTIVTNDIYNCTDCCYFHWHRFKVFWRY